MPVGPHSRRLFDQRDMLPGRARALTEFRQLIARRREFEGGGEFAITTAEVLRANGQDRYVFRNRFDSSGEFEAPVAPGVRLIPGERATLASTRQGSIAIGGPVGGEKRKSEHPTGSQSHTFDLLELELADPDSLELGETVEVTFTGIGFSDDPVDIIEAVVPDPTTPDALLAVRADVTVGVVTYVSETQVTADVTRDSTPPESVESEETVERITFRPRRG
jgi:hypothetical protein